VELHPVGMRHVPGSSEVIGLVDEGPCTNEIRNRTTLMERFQAQISLEF
jgi:hypothetical protein